MILFWLITIPVVVLTSDASLLLHEWSHSTVAWLYGLKAGPFCIHYGDWTLRNAYAVDSGNFYGRLFASGQDTTAALIAIAGPNTNLVLALLCTWLLARRTARPARWPHLILFWFLLQNLGQVYCYIPIRLFSPTGDIANFMRGMSLSPWVMGPVVLVVLVWLLWISFSRLLPWLLDGLGIHGKGQRQAYYALSLALVFGWFGSAPLFYYGAHDIRTVATWASWAFCVAVFLAFRRRMAERRGVLLS